MNILICKSEFQNNFGVIYFISEQAINPNATGHWLLVDGADGRIKSFLYKVSVAQKVHSSFSYNILQKNPNEPFGHLNRQGKSHKHWLEKENVPSPPKCKLPSY